MIRSVAPGDLWKLRRKTSHQIMLYTEGLLVQTHRPAWFALRCLLRGNGREMTTAIYHDWDGRAVIQSQGRPGRPEQDVVYLAADGTPGAHVPRDYELWYQLLHYICHRAGASYVQRLYAAVPSEHNELREIFRQTGFHTFTHTTILHLSGPDWDQRTTLAPMRSQLRHDHWAIQKLYGAITPHQVQHAEVRNAHSWALPLADHWVSWRRAAWVLGPDDDLTGYLRLSSGPTGHLLSLLVRPDSREQVVDMLRFGLNQLHDSRPVYLLLYEYQSELIAPAEALGFQPIGEQAMLVKYTVVPVRRLLLTPSLDTGMKPRLPARRIAVPREDQTCYV